MSDHRPVFLDIPKMRFPVTALVSIGHRISGFVLFLFIPLLIFMLHKSLVTVPSFYQLKAWIHQPHMLVMLWVLLAAVTYHFFAGMRHILMDFGVGESMCQATFTAYLVFALTVIGIILEGVWLW